MNEKINQIIEELIAIDPGFGKHKDELEKILLSVLALKPEPVIDADFVRKLRLDLLASVEHTSGTGIISNIKQFFMNTKYVASGSVIALLIVAIVGLQVFGNFNNKSKLGLLSFGSDVRITHASDGAFGNLATLTAAMGLGGGSNSTSPTSTAALGTDAARSSLAYGMGGGGMGISEKMIAPYPYESVTYKYVYKGDDLNLTSDKLDVLKKQSPNTSDLTSSLNSLGLGLVDLGSFPGSKVQSISFNQDNGYNLYVDLVSGMISISGYYDIMPLADGVDSSAVNSKLCPVDGCPAPNPVKESDIPDDATLISASNQFLSDHSISTSAYGTPEVMNDYRVQIQAQLKASPKSLVYWPEYINVVYPLKIQDGEVYDESGNKTGLMVGVSIRSHKVTSVWNLSTQDYQASSYDAETDSARILKVAESGGMYNYYYGDGSGKTVEIDLGTPKIQYVQMWDYQTNSSQQVLVPSLVFPVTKQPDDGSFYRQSVIVPLIKNILDRDQGMGGGPIKTLEGNTSTGTAVPPAATK